MINAFVFFLALASTTYAGGVSSKIADEGATDAVETTDLTSLAPNRPNIKPQRPGKPGKPGKPPQARPPSKRFRHLPFHRHR